MAPFSRAAMPFLRARHSALCPVSPPRRGTACLAFLQLRHWLRDTNVVRVINPLSVYENRHSTVDIVHLLKSYILDGTLSWTEQVVLSVPAAID